MDCKAVCEQISEALDRLGDAAYLPMNAAELSTISGALDAMRKLLAGSDAVIQLEAKRWGL